MKKEDTPFIITIIQDLASVSSLVNSFFNNDKKTTQWLNTKNPLLGEKEPIEMIFEGKTEKLIGFINSRLEGNTI